MASVTGDLLQLYTSSDALGLGQKVRAREVSPAELVEAAATVIDRLNPQLNAVIHKLYDMARAQAATVPMSAPFAGVPFLLKELASMWQGAPLTNSSVWMKDVISPIDSEAAKRTKAAGFVLVGKSNAPENGWSISTEPKLYGVTHNPWRADVTAGGSSGGAASAVASHMVPLAEASDGAGSIRVPASNCGLVGLKPSRGRITIAPFGDYWYGGAYFFCVSRTVRDSAAYLDAMAGAVPGDPYTPPTPAESWLSLSTRVPRRLRVGFTVTPPDGGPIDPEAVAAVRNAAALLARLGHDVEEKNMTLDGAAAWKTYTAMTPAETAAAFENLAALVGRPVTQADVEPTTWAVIQAGRAQTAVQHVNLMNALRGLSRDIAADLLPYDVYLTPTLTQKPRPLGYYDMSETDLLRYNAKWTDAMFMFPFNITSLPAISLPLHMSADGLPMGVQAIGRYGDEATLLAVASVFEAEVNWGARKPPVCA